MEKDALVFFGAYLVQRHRQLSIFHNTRKLSFSREVRKITVAVCWQLLHVGGTEDLNS